MAMIMIVKMITILGVMRFTIATMAINNYNNQSQHSNELHVWVSIARKWY